MDDMNVQDMRVGKISPTKKLDLTRGEPKAPNKVAGS